MELTGAASKIEPSPLDVSSVPVELVPAVWAKLLPQIEKALSHGDGDSTTPEHMLAAVLSGRMQLWAVHEGEEIIAGVIVSARTYTAKTTVVINLLAGRDMDRWADRIEQLLRDLRDLIGANTIEASCRAGLAHRLGKRGWKRKAVIMELE